METPNQETQLIKNFLEDYGEMLNREGIPFHPRNLTIVSQPFINAPECLNYISYNKWFDENDLAISVKEVGSLLEAFLDIPINILLDAEYLGKPLISKKDSVKLIKALKLLKDIKIERQV